MCAGLIQQGTTRNGFCVKVGYILLARGSSRDFWILAFTHGNMEIKVDRPEQGAMLPCCVLLASFCLPLMIQLAVWGSAGAIQWSAQRNVHDFCSSGGAVKLVRRFCLYTMSTVLPPLDYEWHGGCRP